MATTDLMANMAYRSKPTVIHAIQFTEDTASQVELLLGSSWFNVLDPEDRGDDPEIVAQVFDKLHSTWVGVKYGQYIIRGTKAELYPCDPEVFEEKYEPVV